MIAVGPGRVTETGTKIPVSVSVGDTVLLPDYGGQTLKLGDEELSLFRDEDILGKFEVSTSHSRSSYDAAQSWAHEKRNVDTILIGIGRSAMRQDTLLTC